MNVLTKHNELNNKLINEERLSRCKYGFELTDNQLKVFNCKDGQSSFVFKRQEGCTMSACLKALDFAINNPLSESTIYLPTIKNVEYVTHLLLYIFEQHEPIQSMIQNRSLNLITLYNGSSIRIERFNESLIRGRKNDLVILDNVRLHSEYELSLIMSTTLSSSIGQAIMLNQNDSFMTNLQ